MAGAAGRAQLGDEIGERWVAVERAVGGCAVDAREDLRDDAAGADIHMADLGIAHLAVGQTDIAVRGVEQAVWATRHQSIPDRRPCLGDGIVVVRVAVAPTVEDAQHDRAEAFVHAAVI